MGLFSIASNIEIEAALDIRGLDVICFEHLQTQKRWDTADIDGINSPLRLQYVFCYSRFLIFQLHIPANNTETLQSYYYPDFLLEIINFLNADNTQIPPSHIWRMQNWYF